MPNVHTPRSAARRGPTALVAVAAVLLALTACSDLQAPDLPRATAPGTHARSLAAEGLREGESLDAFFVRIARQEVPGFGGFFYDSAGTPTVLLTDTMRAASARARVAPLLAVARAFGAGRRPGGTQVRVRAARYDFARLNGWHEALNRQLVGVSGVQYTDTDEAANRVAVAVTDPAAAASVRARARDAGLPDDALRVDLVPAVEPLAALSDQMTRPAGGIYVVGVEPVTGTRSACTLGANVYDDPYRTKRYFVTASHCTGKEGVVSSTAFYQLEPRLIGTEVHDYPFNGTDARFVLLGRTCPGLCRFADVAFVEYASAVTWELGGIARPLALFPATNYQTINPAAPLFTVTGRADRPVLNERLEKVGVGSGWSWGTVTQTCVDLITQTNTGQTAYDLCQDRLQGAAARGGDSGAPVFRHDGSGHATLMGIVSVGLTGTPSYLLFGSIRNIELQFGQTFGVVGDSAGGSVEDPPGGDPECDIPGQDRCEA